MLPSDLIGPGESIHFPGGKAFLVQAIPSYPDLHPDFIRQACCEHPDRMDEYFPKFDLRKHRIEERLCTAAWIETQVRYDDGESLASDSFYGFHIDQYKRRPQTAPQVCRFMLEQLTWPFPPIVVEATFANHELGSVLDLGKPFHLFEGTHRVSYLLRLLEMKLVAPDSRHAVLVIEGR